MWSIISLVITYVLRALCILKAWYWFLLPVFNNLPDINFEKALGLSFVVGLFQGPTTADYYIFSEEYKLKCASRVSLIVNPIIWALTLLIFYLIHLFIN